SRRNPAMRRKFLALALLGVVVGLAAVFWYSQRTTAQPPADNLARPVRAAAAPLPVAQVILFSSGVGYFQREGEIDGDTQVDLTFPATDINDLLKSLVLQDLGGGKVSAVSYDSPDPVEKTLKSFALDL